jgi:hypothetical protein
MELEKAEIPSDKVAMMEEFERRKRVRAITVSTNDSEVGTVLTNGSKVGTVLTNGSKVGFLISQSATSLP